MSRTPHPTWLLGIVLLLLTPRNDALAADVKGPSLVSAKQGIILQSKFIMKNPKNTKAYVSRADHYLTLARHRNSDLHLRAAADDLAVATTLSPNDPEVHRRYAAVAIELREYQLAVVEYSAAIKHAPTQARHYLGRGLAYFSLWKNDRAQADFRQALKLEPGLRERLEVERNKARLTRFSHEAEWRMRQVRASVRRRDGLGPDLACTNTTPIHLNAQCGSPHREAIFP